MRSSRWGGDKHKGLNMAGYFEIVEDVVHSLSHIVLASGSLLCSTCCW